MDILMLKNHPLALFSRGRVLLRMFLSIILLSCLLRGSAVSETQNHLNQGFDDMYNLAFQNAHYEFAVWMKEHPDDPMGPAADESAYLFSEFDRLGILDVELFSDDQRFEHRKRPAPDIAAKTAFLERIGAAEKLADKILQSVPNNAHSLFVKTLVYGLRSDYQGLIEKDDLAALVYSKRAGEFAKQTLAADPTLYDAYLGVGVENYILGLKPAPVRWVLHLAGAETNKMEGLQQLQLTAEKGNYLAPFARLLLAVAAIRDHQILRAKELLTNLHHQYPGNTLYYRELVRLH